MYNLNNLFYQGIQGVDLIDSGNEGTNLGISVCTHGGEVVGLDILKYLINNINISKNIKNGKIFFILNNISEYQKFLDIKSKAQKITEKELISARFIDENMNRCCTEENIKNGSSIEVVRIKELIPVLDRLDIIFDIHSTYSPSDSMIILTKKSYEKFKGVFNVDKELIGITERQIGKPFIDIVERKGGIGIGIECGCQLDNTGYKIGIDNLLRLLIDLGMVDGNLKEVQKGLNNIIQKQTLNILSSIIVKGKKFKFYKDYRHLDQVNKGELFCFDGEKDIYSDKDFLIIMPKTNSEDATKMIGEEGCFMGEII